MVVKRDIRQEVANRSRKDFYIHLVKIFKYLANVDKTVFRKIFFLRIIKTIEPIITLYLLQELINDAVKGEFSINLLLIFGFLAVLIRYINYILGVIEIEYQYLVEYKCNMDIQRKILALRISDFENKNIHNSLRRADNGKNFFKYYYRKILETLFSSMSIVIYLIILINYNWWLITILLFITGILFSRKINVLKENFITQWEKVDLWRKRSYYNFVLTEDQHLREAKILNADSDFSNKYKKFSEEIKNVVTKIEVDVCKSDLKIKITNSLSLTIFYAYLIYNLASFKVKLGNFNTYRVAFSNIINSLDMILNNFIDFEVDSLEMKEFFNFIEHKIDFVDGKNKIKSIDEIEFKGVSFKYNESADYVIKNVSFKIKKGENVAFIGPNGSGKTTIMKLIEKVYLPTKGEILINGINIKELNTKSIRDKISMLLQDFNLFQESVKENILVKDIKMTDKEAFQLITCNDLKKRINELPEKINTVIGNWFGDGINFSSGQIQKLAISRVFAQQGDFVLLDEPNSSLDPKSEKEMFKFIQQSKNKKTCIITLHIFTNIDLMDNIIMFEKGEIVAYGPHKELYKSNKTYKGFYDLQERPIEE